MNGPRGTGMMVVMMVVVAMVGVAEKLDSNRPRGQGK